jgi:hypothetical protein
MVPFELAKTIHEDRLRESERKRFHQQILQEKARQQANAAPSAGRRMLLNLGALLFLLRRL